MKYDPDEPLYTIGTTAKILKVCPDTLRIWEKKGLIKAARVGKNRFYSQRDMERLEYIKKSIQTERMNIEGVKKVLAISRCWEVKSCPAQKRDRCIVYKKQTSG